MPIFFVASAAKQGSKRCGFRSKKRTVPPPESLTPRGEVHGRAEDLHPACANDTLQRLPKGVFVIPTASSGRAQMLAALAVGALCVGSAGVGFALWSFGSSLSPDSVTYLDMAQSIAQGKGITHRWAYWEPVYQTGALPTATTLWPPGYPLTIAALVTLGLDPYVAASVICLLSFALLPVPIYGLARFLLPSGRALICTGVVIALSPIVESHFGVAAESPFLLLSTLSLLYTVRGLQAQTSHEATYSWLTASATAAAAFLMRYVGVACAVGVVVAALLPGGKKDLQTRAVRLAVTAGPVGLILAAVFLRNWIVSGTLVPALLGSDRFWQTLWPSVRSIVGSIIGSKDLLGPQLSLLRPLELALLSGLTGLAVVSLWQARAAARNHHLPLPGGLPSAVIGLFIILGMAVPVRAAVAAGIWMESRYITIYLPWCFVLLLGWALRVGEHDTWVPRAVIVRRCTYLACLVWVSCQLVVSTLSFSSREESYVAAGSRSPTIAWVRMNVPRNETVLTNRGADLAYWSPNPILRLPRPPFSKGLESWDGVDRLANKAQARYLAHFFGSPETPKWDEPEGFRFLRMLDMPERFPERRPISFSDGVVYHVGR